MSRKTFFKHIIHILLFRILRRVRDDLILYEHLYYVRLEIDCMCLKIANRGIPLIVVFLKCVFCVLLICEIMELLNFGWAYKDWKIFARVLPRRFQRPAPGPRIWRKGFALRSHCKSIKKLKIITVIINKC